MPLVVGKRGLVRCEGVPEAVLQCGIDQPAHGQDQQARHDPLRFLARARRRETARLLQKPEAPRGVPLPFVPCEELPWRQGSAGKVVGREHATTVRRHQGVTNRPGRGPRPGEMVGHLGGGAWFAPAAPAWHRVTRVEGSPPGGWWPSTAASSGSVPAGPRLHRHRRDDPAAGELWLRWCAVSARVERPCAAPGAGGVRRRSCSSVGPGRRRGQRGAESETPPSAGAWPEGRLGPARRVLRSPWPGRG